MRTSPRGAIAHKVLLSRNFQIQIQMCVDKSSEINNVLKYEVTHITTIVTLSTNT